MGAIDYLRDHGFDAKVNGDSLAVSPASKLTADVRQYIKAHKLELIEELSAANDPPPHPMQPVAPLKHDPPPAPQHFIRNAATAAPEWIAARDQYINHLMDCRACYAPTGRYCVAGADLRQQYNATDW
jgi:hypothetical protein